MCVILSMYGGGFATVPAYLADMFGTQFVGAIHGRLLTAWSTAGVIGPLADHADPGDADPAGVPKEQAYQTTLYMLAGFLVLGFVCNLLIRPVCGEVVHARTAGGGGAADGWPPVSSGIGRGGLSAGAVLAWSAVGVPLAWGVWVTLDKARVLLG